MGYTFKMLLAALLLAAGPALAQTRIGPVKPGGTGGARGFGKAGPSGVSSVNLPDMSVGLKGSLPDISTPEVQPGASLALPAPVMAVAQAAEAGELAAREEMNEFLRRSVAVHRRNANLQKVQEQIRAAPEGEKAPFIAESNRLQGLQLEDLIEEFYPQEEAERTMDDFLGHIRNAQLTINIDPNMILSDGRSLLDGLMEDGVYKNYSETGVTQGMATDARAGVEDRLFEGLAGAPASERPKYGALNVLENPAGGAPRYSDYTNGEKGVYFVLKEDVKKRSTITARDTLDNMGMSPVGTFASPAYALKDMPREDLLALYLWRSGDSDGVKPNPRSKTGPEVQVFGDVRIDNTGGTGDVQSLRVHSSLRGTPAEAKVQALADKYKIELVWY